MFLHNTAQAFQGTWHPVFYLRNAPGRQRRIVKQLSAQPSATTGQQTTEKSVNGCTVVVRYVQHPVHHVRRDQGPQYNATTNGPGITKVRPQQTGLNFSRPKGKGLRRQAGGRCGGGGTVLLGGIVGLTKHRFLQQIVFGGNQRYTGGTVRQRDVER